MNAQSFGREAINVTNSRNNSEEDIKLKKLTILRGTSLLAIAALLSLSQSALAELKISGWINEGVQFYDDGVGSDSVQSTDNGTTLASRINFSAETEVTTGIKAGFEVIIEPRSSSTPLIFSNQSTFGDSNGHVLGVLGNSLNISGAAGKLTVGLQSMPTDNIAVLEDPSLTLWSGISPIFRGNGFSIQGAGGRVRAPDSASLRDDGSVIVPAVRAAVPDNAATTHLDETVAAVTAADVRYSGGSNGDTPVWGDFLNCFTASGLRGVGGIGIDCNGIYRQGVRYDLPTFGPVSVAVGWANDDVYDVSAKYKGNIGRISSQLALGYAINAGANGSDGKSGGGANPIHYSEPENFQIQLGLMDTITGLFGTIAYQNEQADLNTAAIGNLFSHAPRIRANTTDVTTYNALTDAQKTAQRGATTDITLNDVIVDPNHQVGTVSDGSDAWWFKVGIKKKWFAAGDTSFAFDYGLYSDQYGFNEAVNGVTGSEVERLGFSVDQYFGSGLIIYGKWEQLELEVDGTTTAQSAYGGGEELSTFTLGATYFF